MFYLYFLTCKDVSLKTMLDSNPRIDRNASACSCYWVDGLVGIRGGGYLSGVHLTSRRQINSVTSLLVAFLQNVCPNHVNLGKFSCETLSRLSNLEVDIYDLTFKSIWNRYQQLKELGNLFNVWQTVPVQLGVC